MLSVNENFDHDFAFIPIEKVVVMDELIKFTITIDSMIGC